jgi:putative Ca2+/H+ antiporter (TMEM165/GDT1 family)
MEGALTENPMKTYLAVFASVLVAEMGDKTQLATVLFATNPAVSKVGIFAAAALALVLSSLLAVVAGGYIGTWVPAERLRVLAGVGFIGIGLWMLLTPR